MHVGKDECIEDVGKLQKGDGLGNLGVDGGII